MTWGVLRTRLLLPAGATAWAPHRLRSVLLHEFAHVRRRDTISHILAQVACALYWFHPLAWVAARRMREECERACDDLVLRSGVKASDYAEDLIGILVPGAIPSAALAIAGQTELEGRVRAILDEGVRRHPIPARGLLAVSLVAAVSTTAVASLRPSTPPSAGAPTVKRANPAVSQAQPAEQVTAVCVDMEGRPVPDAEVHLFQYVGTADEGHYVHTGPFTSDESGVVACSDAIAYEGGNHDRWFYARVPGRLVGAARSAKWTNQAVINPEGRIVLQESRSIEGRVTVPPGFDPAQVRVIVRTMQFQRGPEMFDFDTFTREPHFPGLDTALPEIFECRPDADGIIRFDDVPSRGKMYLVTSGAGLAQAQWANLWEDATVEAPIRLTVEEERPLSGRVLSPDGNPAAGMDVFARLSPSGTERVPYLSTFKATTDDEGAFVIHGLPEIGFVLSVKDPEGRWAFRPIEDMIVHEQDPKPELEMEPGVLVSGRILNGEGQPVEGAALSAIAHEKGGPGIDNDMTAADGRYELRLPAGEACLYFNSLPDGYAYPEPQIVERLEIRPGQDNIQGLDFVLPRKPD